MRRDLGNFGFGLEFIVFGVNKSLCITVGSFSIFTTVVRFHAVNHIEGVNDGDKLNLRRISWPRAPSLGNNIYIYI